MSWVLFGLVCLCCMSFGWTKTTAETSTETSTSSTETSTETSTDPYIPDDGVPVILFQVMDSQRTRDKKVTIPEYEGTWKAYDKNRDKFFSRKEFRELLDENLMDQSSDAEEIFGDVDLNDRLRLGLNFISYDRNNDNSINMSEFVSGYLRQRKSLRHISQATKKP